MTFAPLIVSSTSIMRPSSLLRRSGAGICAIGLLLGACGGEQPIEDNSQATAGSPPASFAADDARVQELREALEAGHLDRALALSQQLGSRQLETRLLAARAAALGADDTRATRLIEEARREAPLDARVYATAAEIHAAAGRLDTAEAEIQRGLEACGTAAELERARGVWLICQAGGARPGLEMLQAAVAHDPTLPFVHRPLGQAHLLVAKECARADDWITAFAHAEKAVEHDPADVDSRRFLAELKTDLFDFGGALALYEELLAEGEALAIQAAQTYKNAAVAAMAQGQRQEAVLYFLRARHLGMGDDELGSGAGILRDVARERLDEAWTLRERGDAQSEERARELLADALTHEPELASDTLERAELAWRDERLEECKDWVERARWLEPESESAQVLACLLKVRETLDSGTTAEARRCLRREGEGLPQDARMAAEGAWLVARTAAEGGDVEQARELHRAALSHDPEHTRARFEFIDLCLAAGVTALKEGRVQDARDELAEALACDPTRIDARHFFGQALFEAGEYEPAAREWKRVLAEARAGGLELPDPVHVHLARAQFFAGDESASRETLEDYLSAHPEGPFLEETRRVLDALPTAEGDG